MAAPVETKVQASTGAAAISGLALWSLGHWVFKGDVPDVVASWVYVLIPGLLAFTAGYLAKHTPRPAVPPAPLRSYEAPSVRVAVPPLAEKTLAPPAAPE